VVLANDHKIVLRALFKAGRCPFILEEIAATAAVSFERAWYAVLEMIELGLIAPAGIGLYDLSQHGKDIASRVASSGRAATKARESRFEGAHEVPFTKISVEP
jgi:hypothetical protein